MSAVRLPARRPARRWAWLLALLLVAAPVPAAQQVSARVAHHAGGFQMHSVVLVDLRPAAVKAILTDYERLPEVNSGLKRVEVLARDGEQGTRMRVQSRVCVLGICLRFRWVQAVRVLAGGEIVSRIEPDSGDFRDGEARWRLEPAGEGTRLVFDATLVPDFWFPPLIGPWLIKRKLAGEALETAIGLERVAAARAPDGAAGSAPP